MSETANSSLDRLIPISRAQPLFSHRAGWFIVLSALALGTNVHLSIPLACLWLLWAIRLEGPAIVQRMLVTLPIVVLAVFGAANGYLSDLGTRDILRDAYYLTIFLSIFIVGQCLAVGRVPLRDVLSALAVALAVRLAISGFRFVIALKTGFGSVEELRGEVGQTSNLSAALILPSLHAMPSVLRWTFLLALLPSFLSFGRSSLLTLIFLFASRIPGWIRIALVITAISGVAAVFSLQSDRTLIDSFIEKIEGSYSEVSDDTFYGVGAIHQRWRAYERYIVGANIAAADNYTKLIGEGLGAVVQASVEKRQGAGETEYTSEIPIFHDSTLFIQLKLGYSGLAVWLAWWASILFLSWRSLRRHIENKYDAMLHFCAILVFIVSGSLFYGYPLMRNVGIEAILIGYLVALSAAYQGARSTNQNQGIR